MPSPIKDVPPRALDGRSKLSVVHWGQFSGAIPRLAEALDRRVDAAYHDVARLTRDPRLAHSRTRAHLTAGDGIWYKSAVWSSAVQRRAIASGWIVPSVPVLFCQTLAAPVLDPEVRYVVYTDRVGKEGARGTQPFRSRWGPGWIEREENFLAGAEAVLVMGPSTKDVLVNDYGIDGAKVEVVGSGPASPIGPLDGVPREPRQLLFAGTNWLVKGGPEVIAALDKVRARRPELSLVVVGEYPDVPLPEGASALGRVSRSAMHHLFAGADLFVAPARMEAFGFSLLEALLHGVPAIGSTVGNQSWLIGDAGLTVEPGDVNGLVAAIDRAIDTYPDLKAAALRRAEELRRTMTWERVADAVVGCVFPGGGPGERY